MDEINANKLATAQKTIRIAKSELDEIIVHYPALKPKIFQIKVLLDGVRSHIKEVETSLWAT